MDMVTFLLHVHTIATVFNGSITSWLRSSKHNQAVGGKPESLHLFGLACDIVFDSKHDEQAAIEMFHRVGLWTLTEPDHLHVQACPPTN